MDKIKDRLASLKAKTLSWAGRSTLIRSVINSILIYKMSLYKLPLFICNEIDLTTRRFWWHTKIPKGQFFDPRCWDNICQPKSIGALGFRKVEDANQAMLSKTARALVSNNNILATKTLKTKYGKFLHLTVRRNNSESYAWKGLKSFQKTIRKGACIGIGNGLQTRVWNDPWVPGNTNYLPVPAEHICTDQVLMVRDLRLFNPIRWNTPLVCNLFNSDMVRATLAIHLPRVEKAYELVWAPNSCGAHSVLLFYLLDQGDRFDRTNEGFWKMLWRTKVHE